MTIKKSNTLSEGVVNQNSETLSTNVEKEKKTIKFLKSIFERNEVLEIYYSDFEGVSDIDFLKEELEKMISYQESLDKNITVMKNMICEIEDLELLN